MHVKAMEYRVGLKQRQEADLGASLVIAYVEGPKYRCRREVEITESINPKTLYSTWETLDKEARRRACGARQGEGHVASIRVVRALTVMCDAGVTEMAALNPGLRITRSTARDVILGKVDGDPAYHVPDRRKALVSDARMTGQSAESPAWKHPNAAAGPPRDDGPARPSLIS